MYASRVLGRNALVLAALFCGLSEFYDYATTAHDAVEWHNIVSSLTKATKTCAHYVVHMPLVGEVSWDFLVAVAACAIMDWLKHGQLWYIWSVVSRPIGENVYYVAQKQHAWNSGAWHFAAYVVLRVAALVVGFVVTRYHPEPAIIFVVTSIGHASGLVAVMWQRKVVSFMPECTPPIKLPQVSPGQVKCLEGQFVVNVDGKLVELDQYSMKYDIQQTDHGLQLRSITVGPLKPTTTATERPEASIPGQLCQQGPPPKNAVKLWVRENGQWKVSCVMNFWRDSVRGHVGTTVVHGLSHLAQHNPVDLGITSAVMSEGLNGGNPFPLVDYLKSSTFDLPNTWQATTYYGPVTHDTLNKCWSDMHGGWKPNIGDLAIVTTNLNFAALGVQFFNLKLINTFQASGHLYSVCNWDPGRTGFYAARVETDPDKARLQGLVYTSASSWPGTSGSSAMTPQKELMFVHAGGPDIAQSEYPNVGYVSTLVRQVIRKHTGGDPRPLYRQGIVQHQSSLYQEISQVCNELDERVEQFVALKASGSLSPDSVFQPLTQEEIERCAQLAAVSPEAGMSHEDRRVLIRAIYAKLRRNKNMKGKSASAIYTFIYHKMSDSIPEVDPEGYDDLEEYLTEEAKDYYSRLYQGSKYEDYQSDRDSDADDYEPSKEPRRKKAKSRGPFFDMKTECSAQTEPLEEVQPECSLCCKAGLQETPSDEVPNSCIWQRYNAPRRSPSTKAVFNDPEGVLVPPPNLGKPQEPYLYCHECNDWAYCRDLPVKQTGSLYPEHYCPCSLVKSATVSAPPTVEALVGEARHEAPDTSPLRSGSANRRGYRITNKRLSKHGIELVSQATLPKTFKELVDANTTHTSKHGFTLSFRRALETGWLKKVVEGPRTMYQACFPESGATESAFGHLPFVNDKNQLDYPECEDVSATQDLCPAEVEEVVETKLRPLIELDTSHTLSVADWCNAIQRVGKELSPTGTISFSLANTSLFRTYLGAETQCVSVDFFGAPDPHFRHIGRAPMAPSGKRREFAEPEPTDLMVAWGLVDEWGRPKGARPPQGPSHEVTSLKAQLRRKSSRTRGYSMAHLHEYATGLPASDVDWSQPLIEYIAQINRRMEASKSSGWSRLTGARTNGEWVSNPQCVRGGLLSVALTMLTHHSTLASWTPEQLFRAGLVVPEEASIKDETHMRKKIESQRWRLIWMTSSRAQFLARFFHDGQNKTELDMYRAGYTHSPEFPYFGSCGGMGHDDQGIVDTCAAFSRLSHAPNAGSDTSGLTSLDAKGWDFSVTRTLLMADAWRRAHLAEVSAAPPAFCVGVYNLGLVLSAHILRSGMSMFNVSTYGIVGSGMISTTASNSFMRTFAHSEAFWHTFGKVSRALANGDDCIGHDTITQSIVGIWEELGLQLDDEEDIRTQELSSLIHFTSHVYNVYQECAEYGNQDKLFLKLALLHSSGKLPTAEQLAGIRVAIRHTPDALEKLDMFIRECCPGYTDVNWDHIHADMSLMDA